MKSASKNRSISSSISSLCALHQAAGRTTVHARKLVALGVGITVAGLLSARANTELDVANGQTNLSLAPTYTQNTVPTAASDITFTAATTYAPTAFTAGAAISTGTINSLDTTQTLSITGSAITLNGGANVVAPNAADLLYVASGGTLTVANALALTATSSGGNFNTAGTSTVSGVISGTGFGFTKTGAGALTLSGGNTFTGNLVVNGGTLNASFSNNSAVANGRAFGSFGNEQTAGKTVTINNGATVAFTVGNVLGNSSSTVAQAPAMSFVVNQGSTLLINPTVADGNAFGAITLNGGTLTTGNGFSAQYQVATLLKDITVGGTTASTINSIGTNAATNSIMLGDQAAGNNTINFIVADATGNASADLTVSAKLTNSPTGNNSLGNLAKSGAGTMVLSGVNTYSGTTTVSEGTLVADNDKGIGSTSGLTVSGGTFDLRGTTAGTVTMGTNAAFSLTSGTILFQLGTTSDQLVSIGTGTFTISGGTFSLDVTGPGFSYGNNYTVLSGFGGTNTVSGLNFTGYDTTNYQASLANNGVLSFAAIPEPSTYVLALSGVGMLFLLRRRKAA